MKPNYLTILITTLCIFFNACHNSNTAPQLQLADSLIDKRADSALCILEKLSIEEISNKSAKAMYALLLTEALDKNFKSHRNDSLILIAVDYYKDNSNNKLKTKAYYYLGRVYQDNKEYIKATEHMKRSYSKKAFPWDNACIESFHSVIKREWLNRFKIRDYKQAYQLIFEYLEAFYNTKRIHSHCNYMSPNEFEQMYERTNTEAELLAG